MKTAKIVKCQCGCGDSMEDRDARGRPRKYIHGHWPRLQPHNRSEVACLACGTKFLKPQWHLKQTRRHFCSQVCCGRYDSANGLRRGENNGHYNTITVPCAGCDEPVSKAESLIKRRNGRVYCPKCIPLTRAGNPGFYVGYPKEFSNTLRERIRERDGQVCQVCGKTKDEAGILQVHHIDYDKHNNAPANLITLCCFCHGATNWATETWKAKLQAYQAGRCADV